MSLYYVQKLLWQLNRDPELLRRFNDRPAAVVGQFSLTDEEQRAILDPDIGLLYVLGVNGQILMHYAAARGIAWPDYLEAMRQGITRHGPVRAGLYAMTTSIE